MNRRYALTLLAGTALASLLKVSPSLATDGIAVTLHKTPWCGCCSKWGEHLTDAGFVVTEVLHDDLEPIKERLGVPSALQGCHSAEIGGYVIEGHVPAADIMKLLAEAPDAIGLSVPGMPMGSPGMDMSDEREAYDVVLFSPAGRRVFNHYAEQ